MTDGRKRTLEAIQSQYPSDYEAVTTRTLLDTINTDCLLAVVLSSLWRDAFRLCQVCKRFAAAIKRREFWMPGVRCELAKRLAHKNSMELIPHIDPFFRFPQHMLMVPVWPWWTFLSWMFDRGYVVNTYDVAIMLAHYPYSLEFDFSHFWCNNKNDPSIMFAEKDKNGTSSLGVRGLWRRGLYSWRIHRYSKWVWLDGHLDARTGSLDPRHWCGDVTEHPGGEDLLVPVEGSGFYRDSE